MQLFVEIHRNEYHDSLELLLATSLLEKMEGIGQCNVAMGTAYGVKLFQSLGLINEDITTANAADLIIAAKAESKEVFDLCVKEMFDQLAGHSSDQIVETWVSQEEALQAHPNARLCVISVPSEYAKKEAMKALKNDMHVILFSSGLATEDELDIKTYAREHGLLCMGPDCGVVNLNGVAFLLGSITRQGAFGLCGASGVGVQHVGALIHAAGYGCSQIIGTGGGDLKALVGGLSMQTGIDALEADPQTKYIVLISRKPDPKTLDRILKRISLCIKPVVACFMGADRSQIEASGAIFAADLDDAATQALKLIGASCPLQTEEELENMASEAIIGMAPEQKYLRGLFTGGTYCEEAMNIISHRLGNVYSNAPLRPDLQLKDSLISVSNTCLDVGENEFTQGKLHPTMEPAGRRPFIIKEGSDPETCVLLLDFIFAVSAHPDPVGVVIDDIIAAMDQAKQRGGKLAVVASICGTDNDYQDLYEQQKKLKDAGVYLCQTNRLAADLAARIVAKKNGGC